MAGNSPKTTRGPVVSLEDLIEGKPQAWKDFLENYGGLIRSIGIRFGLGPEARDDLVQNVCLRIHTRAESIDDADRFSSWLYTVAINESRQLLRKQRPTASLDDPDHGQTIEGIADQTPPPDEIAEAILDAKRVRTSLGQISERCRSLLRVLYFHEPPLEYHEVSEKLGIPIGSIGPTRARCLKKLAIELEEVSGDDPDDSPPTTEGI